MADKQYAPTPPEFKPRENWKPNQELEDWKQQVNDNSDQRKQALVLVGPSMTGKSTWARSLCTDHVFWRGSKDLDTYYPEASLVIFDDVNLEYLGQSKKAWIAGEHQFTDTDKYHRKKQIFGNHAVVFLWNTLPTLPSDIEQEWFDANTTVVYVTEPMYN